MAALVSVILIATSLGQTIKILYGAYVVEADDSYKEVVRFINDNTPAGALIETYESELFFLLNRRYHYPPDQVHVDLIRRNSLGERVKIDSQSPSCGSRLSCRRSAEQILGLL